MILHTDNGGTVGFEQIKRESPTFDFSTYPNPFSNQSTVAFSLLESEYVNITIVDISGKEHINVLSGNLEKGKHKIVWDTSHLQTGIYIIVVMSGKEISTEKVIKIE